MHFQRLLAPAKETGSVFVLPVHRRDKFFFSCFFFFFVRKCTLTNSGYDKCATKLSLQSVHWLLYYFFYAVSFMTEQRPRTFLSKSRYSCLCTETHTAMTYASACCLCMMTNLFACGGDTIYCSQSLMRLTFFTLAKIVF